MGMKLDFVSRKEEAYKTAFHGLADVIIFRVFRPYFFRIWHYTYRLMKKKCPRLKLKCPFLSKDCENQHKIGVNTFF
jgi:hypothetical protein